jgi:hypothetical protein
LYHLLSAAGFVPQSYTCCTARYTSTQIAVVCMAWIV